MIDLDDNEVDTDANGNQNQRNIGKGKFSDQVRLATVDDFQASSF